MQQDNDDNDQAAGPVFGDQASIPTVDFYGDGETWATSTLLHSEPLIERSQRHHWRIRPHRHSNIEQLFLLRAGRSSGRLDTVEYMIDAPCVVVVPALCVHEFLWSPESEGFVLSIASGLINDLTAQIGSPGEAFNNAAVVDAGTEIDYVGTLFERIQFEYAGNRPMKEIALGSLIRSLAIWLAREKLSDAPASEPASRASHHYHRFVGLIEHHYREHWSVVDYAREIGISAPHLNGICRKQNGISALRMIHERVLLAARRELVYSNKSIAVIASGLGFSEPSYFTRFFVRHMEITPRAYRRLGGTFSS